MTPDLDFDLPLLPGERAPDPTPIPFDLAKAPDPVQEIRSQGGFWFQDFVARMTVDFGFFAFSVSQTELSPALTLFSIIATHPKGLTLHGSGTWKELYLQARQMYQDAKDCNGEYGPDSGLFKTTGFTFSDPIKRET